MRQQIGSDKTNKKSHFNKLLFCLAILLASMIGLCTAELANAGQLRNDDQSPTVTPTSTDSVDHCLRAYLGDNISEDRLQQLLREIEEISDVGEVTYIDSAESLQRAAARNGGTISNTETNNFSNIIEVSSNNGNRFADGAAYYVIVPENNELLDSIRDSVLSIDDYKIACRTPGDPKQSVTYASYAVGHGDGEEYAVTTQDNAITNVGITANNDAESSEQFNKYWAGENLVISDGDHIGGDLIGAGKNIRVHDSNILGNIRCAAQEINIGDNVHVARDVTIAVQDVILEHGSTIIGDVYIAGRNVTLNGKVSGKVIVYAQNVTFGGEFLGDVEVHAQKLVVDSGTMISKVITGDVDELDSDSSIDADKLHVTVGEISNDDGNYAIVVVGSLLGIIACTLLVEMIAPKRSREAVSIMLGNKTRSVLSGVLFIMLGIPLSVLMCCSVIALPIGVAMLLGYVLILLVAMPFSAFALARLLLPRTNKFVADIVFAASIGLLACMPYVSVIVAALSFLFTSCCAARYVLERRGNDSATHELAN